MSRLEMCREHTKQLLALNKRDVETNVRNGLQYWTKACRNKTISEICNEITQYVTLTSLMNNLKGEENIGWLIGSHIKIIEAIRNDADFDDMFERIYNNYYRR